MMTENDMDQYVWTDKSREVVLMCYMINMYMYAVQKEALANNGPM